MSVVFLSAPMALSRGFVTLDQLSVTCSQESICAVKGTEVTLKCSYSNINIKTVFWFSEKQSTNWRKNNEPEDLTLDSDYSGRVKHQISSSSSTLTISDVRERDSGEYQLMFIMNDGVKHLSSAAVSLTVTDLQVRINPVSTDLTDERVQLTCDSSCTLTSGGHYYWMKNGRHFKYTQSSNMFVSISRDAGSFSCSHDQNLKHRSSSVCVSQRGCWDVTYTSTRVCALVNSTVDISCTYSHPSDHTVNKTFWHYGPSDGRSQDFKDLREEHQFAGRVEKRKNNSSQQHEDTMESEQSGSAVLYENAAALSTVCTQQVHTNDQDVQYPSINFKQSHTMNTSSAPTAVDSTTDDVHYAAVKFR
ncbi:sialoadhesin-like isoform X1 [Labeo rohita]|uniref:Sialoadhesin-like isoform X1 n=1 Tax=Labeo rohita TaxID=84645 RepID=A0A498LB76_LABRO|nr:sialoadhesin-like isoform X1 [Labeo rohita]